jgi:hypothetical protein
MADSAILAAGGNDAPLSYLVPGASAIRIKQIHVAYVDNGAAGDWLPAVRIVSDSSHTMGLASDQGVKVTAGSDADVSFFPVRKQAAAAASATGAEWFFASRVTNFTVTTTAPQRRIPWTHFVTSDATVFSVTSGLGTNDTVHGLKAGIYLAYGQLAWASPQTYPHSCLIVTDFFGVSSLASTDVSDSTVDTTPVGNPYNVHDSLLAITQAVPGEISLTAKNWDVSNHVVTSAFYAVAYWPNSTLVT